MNGRQNFEANGMRSTVLMVGYTTHSESFCSITDIAARNATIVNGPRLISPKFRR
jgi:hypothetical protein